MGDSEMQSDFDIKGLSLIDVSSEDDCLIKSPLCVPTIHQSSEKGSGTKTVRFALDPDNIGSVEEAGGLEETPGSLELDKTRKNGKYNLRKSLAWDSAFFTSAGFLEPEELSSMLGGNETDERHTLPGIQEDVSRSYDSLTTLDSETLTLESSEADLFEDIRASIQKSNKVSNTANSSGEKELKTMESRTVSSSKKVELTTQDKMNQKAALKKPNIGAKDTGKTLKQSVARSGESASSLHKPPVGLSRVGPISTTPTKRVSLGAKNVKMEKDAKSVTGRGTTVLKASALSGSKNIVPRCTLSTKSSLCSPASSKTEQISNPSKIVPKGKSKAGSSKPSNFLKSSAKLASNISPASSISEWSSESTSSISAADQSANIVRASLGTGSHNGLATNCDGHTDLDSQNHPTGRCSPVAGVEVTGSLDKSVNKVSGGTSGLLHPASMKPSGLRMPSPKIGFFDGVRSSGRTPTGSMLSHPSVPSGLPKIGAKSTSPSGSSNNAKIGKFQPIRTLIAVQSPKVEVKQTSSVVKPRSSLSAQKSTNAATKVPSASRNPKSSPDISPKLQNKSFPRTGRESYSKALGIGSAEKIISQVAGLGGKDGARIKDTKIVPFDGVPETADNLTSKFDVQNTITLEETVENETYTRHQYLKTNTLSLYNTTKEEAPVEDQIAGLVRNGSTVGINSDTWKESIADGHKEFENSLSNPTPSPVASEITSGSRIPFSVKDSFYNIDAPLEGLSGAAVAVDKTTILPVPESVLPENC